MSPRRWPKAAREILFVPNGSPYYRGKFGRRMSIMVARVIETGLPMVYLNQVGGQDDLMYDGGSFVLNPRGRLMVQLPLFEECIAHVDLAETADRLAARSRATRPAFPDEWEQDYRVMVETLRDYLRKCGFSKVLLGLSGGVDSALVATIAADAIGPENVRAVMLPSEYTSAHSLEDATRVAEHLGLRLDTVPISGPRAAVTEALAPLFDGLAARPHRREHPVPPARPAADGAVEQVRRDAA